MTDYREREITTRILRALNSLPVVVVSGLRQAGKSTLLQHEPGIASGHAYRTLDDFATLSSARSNPEALLSQPVILDEVQRCPELLVAIKRAVDQNRAKGRFILSGSANLALMASVSESLAGRAGYFTLHPLTRREILGKPDPHPSSSNSSETQPWRWRTPNPSVTSRC
jgi:predicted AAA+ superfamily ATPase